MMKCNEYYIGLRNANYIRLHDKYIRLMTTALL